MAAARKESKPLAPPSPSPGPRAPSFTLEEWRGSSSIKLSRTTVLAVDPSSLTLRRFGRRRDELWRKILEAFIPEGFPSSVTNDYVPYQVWDSLQGLSTYIRCMLSTQALLSAIGVGEKSATVIGATFQWFLRDFTGMLGGIMFTFYQGSNLDSNAKMWRLAADFMNDLGMLMDLLSPLFPSALMLIVCLGSLSRSFTGVASGATKAALTQHFSLQNNAADISAKEGSQETVATMVGMAIGMILAHITREHALAMWVSFISLTVFHMYANYRAVQCLQLSTLNSTRSSILLKHFMRNGTVLTPREVSILEHIFPFWANWKSSSCEKSLHQNVRLGVKVSSFTHSEMLEFSASATSHYRKAKYVLFERKGNVMVVVHKEATTPDILRSFFHAAVLASLMGTEKSVHTESRIWMEEQYPVFIDKLKSKGWAIERLLGGSIVWRAHWTPEPLDEKMN